MIYVKDSHYANQPIDSTSDNFGSAVIIRVRASFAENIMCSQFPYFALPGKGQVEKLFPSHKLEPVSSTIFDSKLWAPVCEYMPSMLNSSNSLKKDETILGKWLQFVSIPADKISKP